MNSQLLTIRSLKSNVTRGEAEQAFGLAGLGGAVRRWRIGPLRSVAEVYVPFQLYRVEIQNGSHSQAQLVALDSVTGTLDLYAFEEPPDGEDLVEVSTRNRPEPRLSPAEAERAVVSKVQRVLFQTGFFKMRDLRISVQAMHELHVPYWIAFYGSGERASIRVMDAVRRRMEGAKAAHLIVNWLMN